MKQKILLIVAIIYIISPIDLIPDIIVGIGWLDDILVGALALGNFIIKNRLKK